MVQFSNKCNLDLKYEKYANWKLKKCWSSFFKLMFVFESEELNTFRQFPSNKIVYKQYLFDWSVLQGSIKSAQIKPWALYRRRKGLKNHRNIWFVYETGKSAKNFPPYFKQNMCIGGTFNLTSPKCNILCNLIQIKINCET